MLPLLIFWEWTSLSSFLLIGFRNDKAEGRQGAHMALAVTDGGGLALIAGLLLIDQIAGSFELVDILASGDAIRTSPLYPVALVLFLLARFWPVLAGADLSFSTWYRPRGLVHALDTGDAPAEVARIKSRYERRLLEIFRARD